MKGQIFYFIKYRSEKTKDYFIKNFGKQNFNFEKHYKKLFLKFRCYNLTIGEDFDFKILEDYM